MNRIQRIRRSAAVLAAALLVSGAAPAALASARVLPPPDPAGPAVAPISPVPAVTAGGMPGWQITLIAIAAALFAAATVLAERARLARRRATGPAA